MVREESHLDDMRAAIRGDFERLAERRGAQELMRGPAEAADAEAGTGVDPAAPPTPLPSDEVPVLDAPAAGAGGGETEPPPPGDGGPGPAPLEEPSAAEAPRRSWLARVLGL